MLPELQPSFAGADYMKRVEIGLAILGVCVAILAWLLPIQPAAKPSGERSTEALADAPSKTTTKDLKLDEETQWLYTQTIAAIDEEREVIKEFKLWAKQFRGRPIPSDVVTATELGDLMKRLSEASVLVTKRQDRLFKRLETADFDRKRLSACRDTIQERTLPLTLSLDKGDRLTHEALGKLETFTEAFDSFLGDYKACLQFAIPH